METLGKDDVIDDTQTLAEIRDTVGYPVFGDTITLYRGSTAISRTYIDGEWGPVRLLIDGNLLVDGSITADKIALGGGIIEGTDGGLAIRLGKGLSLNSGAIEIAANLESDNYRTEGRLATRSSLTLPNTGLTFTWPSDPDATNPTAGDGYRIIILRRRGGGGITAPQIQLLQDYMRITLNDNTERDFVEVERGALASAINLQQQGQRNTENIVVSGTGTLRMDFREQDGDYRQWEEGELSGALIALANAPLSTSTKSLSVLSLSVTRITPCNS